MHSILYFHLICFVVLSFYSHSRITCDARTLKEDPPKSGTKMNSSKATSSTGATLRTARMGAPIGKTSGNCQCVAFQYCNHQDVYRPTAGESNVVCGVNEACCIRPQNVESASPVPAYERPVLIPVIAKASSSRLMTNASFQSSTTTSVEVCVAPDRCDQSGLASLYGVDVLIQKNVFSDCRKDELLCPADKVLPGTDGDSSPGPSVIPVPDDKCICITPIYCNAVFGENILMERMKTCDNGEVCCPEDSVRSPDPVSANPAIPVNPPIPASNTECGIRKRDPLDVRVGGGSAVVFGEFPWMVLLIEKKNNKEEVLCGASLVSPTIILTAAHCVYQKNVNSLIVRAGEFDLSSTGEEKPHQDRSIKNYIIHSNYLSKTLIHDLALLIIDTPFTYGLNVAPVCLPLVRSPYSPVDVSIYDFNNCIATGWGIKSNNDMTKPVTLSKIDLKLVPRDQCLQQLRRSKLGPKFILHPSLICAIGAPGTDTCKGDGGGPLICPLKENSDKFVQVGVIAGGLECGSPYPSLYASLLQANSDWITEEISIMSIFDKLS